MAGPWAMRQKQARAAEAPQQQAAEQPAEEKLKLDKIEYRGVPVFAVTDQSGVSPYFTDEEADGSPVGFFFVELTDAQRILGTVKREDKNAKITSLPLKEALNFVRNPNVGAGGHFHVLPSARELNNANNLRLVTSEAPFVAYKDNKIKSADAYDLVPCFYEEKLASVVDGEPTVLVFLKYEDMLTVWEQSTEGMETPPDFLPKVVDFNTLVEKGQDPEMSNVLVVSSESFESATA